MTFSNRLRRQDLKTAFARRFRRQQPVGSYIADFFCAAAKLIVELDGDQHGAADAMTYDENRTQWLGERGYQVMRFANREVLQERERVVGAIVYHLEHHDIPLPEKRCAFSDPPSKGG